MDRRLFMERTALCLAGAVFLGLVAKNAMLTTQVKGLAASRTASRPDDRFAPGDSVLRLPLYERTGEHASVGQYLASGVDRLFFYSPHCGACQRLWPEWASYVATNGYGKVLFVNTDPAPVWSAPPGLDPERARMVRLGSPNPLKGKLPFVPALLVVNKCGIVDEAPRMPSIAGTGPDTLSP